MADFLKKVIPFSTECINWLQNKFALKSHGDHYTAAEITAMINNSVGVGGSLGSMPDYSRAILLFTWNSDNHTNMPIHKINVPGYILASAGYDHSNQDTVIALAANPSYLQTTTGSAGKYIALQGTASDEGRGGAFIAPVTPGTSTYFTCFGGDISYYISFIPCIGVPQSVAKSLMCPYSGFKKTQSFGGGIVAAPGSAEWTATFVGNWQDNI